MKQYYVYILANATGTVVYTGVTGDLLRRVYEHRNDLSEKSFTARYQVHRLVYFETTSGSRAAIEREKQIKSWSRRKKNALVETLNPNWEDLYPGLLG